jgi:ribonuclease P protein component, eubacterial
MPKRFRFPRSHRLTLTAEFRRVRTEGSSVRGETLTLAFWKASEGPAQPRIGLVTSKRVGGAVARNKVRRHLREIFRKNQHKLTPGVWIVTIASNRSAASPFGALEDEWLRLARRASILAP